MGSARRKYTREYKAEAVELVINSGRPVAEVARDLGINEGTLGNWVNRAKKSGAFKEKPLEVNERARLKELGRGESSPEDGAGSVKKSGGVVCEPESVRFAFIARKMRRTLVNHAVRGFLFRWPARCWMFPVRAITPG